MAIKVAINGFGRIGRLVLRALHEQNRDDLQVVAINDLGTVHANAQLLKYDSVHGRFRDTISTGSDWMDVGRGKMKVVAERDPAKLPWKDLKVDVFRASGAGGQHVNTTDSAVRITHLPTGIAVAVQQERSQHQNRAKAIQMLKARLYEVELQKREAERLEAEANKTDIGWGHQIRSYVLQPYQMVKDLRTNVERSDPQKVLDGDLDEFMAASLAARVGEGAKAEG